MLSASEANICIIIRTPPSADLEAAELALALGAFDVPVNLIFSDTGLFWLMQQNARKPNGKTPAKVLSASPMYGVDLYYEADDLALLELTNELLPKHAKALSKDALQTMIAQASQCLTF